MIEKRRPRPENFGNFLEKRETSLHCNYASVRKTCIVRYLKKFEAFPKSTGFSRRMTTIEWHPHDPLLLAAASKGGDVIICKIKKSGELNEKTELEGPGPGGSIQTIKFDPWNNENTIYAVSLSGEFFKYDYASRIKTNILETNDFNKWFLSLDTNVAQGILAIGDTEGVLTAFSSDLKKIGAYKLHRKMKITNIEYSRQEPWLLCTTSNDKFLKLWDIRNLGEKKVEPLISHKHETPVNGALFSRSNGCRLLATDQSCHINIFRAPLWNLERTIQHPHRQFRHLTPIRADWHPHEDIIVVGRYPDPSFRIDEDENDEESVDFFDADSGKLLLNLYGNKKIKCINRFNCNGDTLASSSHSDVLIWQPNFDGDSLDSSEIKKEKYCDTKFILCGTKGRENRRVEKGEGKGREKGENVVSLRKRKR